MKLENRVALVTGAAKGMGHDICLTLAREGANLVLAARDIPPLEALKVEIETLGRRALVVPCDVTDEAAVERMVTTTTEAFGRIDILVNAAGVTGPIETPVQDIGVEDFRAVLEANIVGTFLPTKHVLPGMIARKYGKVVNISGTSGLRGYKYRAAYSSSKWALRGFTRTVALEVGPHNVNVNALHPGIVAGDRMDKLCREKAKKRGWTPEQVHQEYVNEMALRRVTVSQDIANAVLFLVSDDSKNMTGQSVTVDGGWDVDAGMSYRVIGGSQTRADAWEKVLGRPIYAGDLSVAGMLHGKIVRSPYASARIISIDTSAARALPGVVAVLTHADVPQNALRMELPGRMAEATAGAVLATQPVLAEGRVRFQGEPVAAIAAETPEIAAEAAELVRVEYEPLPSVHDPHEAIRLGAPHVHEGGNLLRAWHIRKGAVAEGFKRAEVIVAQTYRTPFVDHLYLETETGIGWIDAEGVLVLRVSTQVLEHFRDVAEVLRLPHGRVRIEGAYLGGGFGGKEDVTVECLLGLLVWKTRRPIQLVFSREESFVGHGKRHPYVLRYKTGATRSGELVAMEAELVSDSGAYAALSPWVLLYSLVTATGPYRVPHVKVDALTVYTNNPIASAYRTFGSIQTCVAYEGQMDALAQALGMDPLELREKNFLRKGDSIATGQVLESEPMLGETMRRAWQALGPARPGQGPIRIARGLAASFTPYGRMCWTRDSASAWVGMELDGTAVVRCAAPDVGGGQTSSLCSITAEVLGLPVAQVSAVGRDSHFTPRAGTTTATRQLLMSGNAVLKAAGEVRRHLVDQAAEMLEAAVDDIELVEGRALVRGVPDRAIAFPALVKAATAAGRPVQALDKYDAPSAPTIDPQTGQGKPFNDYTFGTQAVEVEVDEETGQTRVSKLAACYDIGRVINRQSAEGQIEGGAVQGLGHALLEEVILEDGISKNPHLLDYRIPTTLDAPPIVTILIESGQGLGPFGAKGIGEPAMTPTPAAVMNAVSRAAGAPVTQFPLTAERVLTAMTHPSPPSGERAG